MSSKRINDVRRPENLDNASTNSKCNSIQNTDPDVDAERTKGMTFRDLQVDERFKKLERVLKLSLLNKVDGKKMDRRSGLPMPAWSISSINSMDLSSTAQSLNTSCMCSEVLTSSANLKKTLLDSKRSGNPLERMATSSLKNSPMTPKNILDTLAMPPPSMFGSITHSSKEKSSLSHGKSKNCQGIPSDTDNISSITAPSTSGFQAPQSITKPDVTVPKAYHHNSGYAQGSIKESKKHSPTVFYRWKVILNDQGQLLIKGTLENNRVAHSKPVIRRLTSISVESILKHTYYLEGNIVDDRHELPDYVRGKFYNGFPEDWENVHQIWRSFIVGGCNPTFRWPTPITDSDDDLISEVTDVIFMSERNTRCSNRERERSHTSGRRDSFNTSIYSNSNASLLKDRAGSTLSETPTIPTTLAIPVTNISSVRDSFSKREEYTRSSNSSIAGTTTSSRLEDKLTAIINNLADRNCSQEYIEKVTVMFDCLNYVVNYNKSNDENQSENLTRDASTTSAKNQSQRNNNGILTVASSISNFKEQNLSNSKIDRLGHSEYSNTAISHSPNTIPEYQSKDAGQSNSKRDIDSESESETYSGVPRISADKILRVRNLQERPSKHYVRKPINDFNTSGQKRIDKVLTVNLDRVNNIPATNHASRSHSQSRDNRKLLSYDSSVSIIENPSESETHNGAMCQPHKQTTSRRESVSLSSDLSDIENDSGILNSQSYKGSKPARNPNEKSSPVVAVNNERSREKTPVSTLCQHQKTISVPKDQNEVAEVCDKVPVVTVRQPVEKGLRDMENKKNQNSNIKESETSPSTSGKKRNIVPLGSKLSKAQKTLSPPVLSEKPISPRKKAANNSREKTESTNKDYGSKTNPKVLAAWTPLVVYNPESESKCGLIFEGNLLNEAGHVVNKKFNTDLILRRVSSKIVETVRHEFFQLSGDLKDTKHIIPKELLKQCRSGCPAKITQFCDNWKSLKTDNFIKNIEPLDGSTLNVLSIPTSSRGRRILPPLNYWNGERITFKDNNPVYSPGKTRDTYETSRSTKSRTSFSQDSQDEGKQKNFIQEHDNSGESKKYPATDMKNRTTGTTGRIAKTEAKKSRDDENRRSIRKRRRIVQQLNFSSSDEKEKRQFTPRRRTRSSNRSDEISNGKKMNNSPTVEYTAESSSRMRKDAFGNYSQKSKMAKRQKLDNSPRSKQSSNEMQSGVPRLNKQRSTMRNPEQNITCTYYKNVPLQDNILSDDETSQIA